MVYIVDGVAVAGATAGSILVRFNFGHNKKTGSHRTNGVIYLPFLVDMSRIRLQLFMLKPFIASCCI